MTLANTKWFGDKAFYKRVMVIALPIMIQNGITNLVGLLDNVMVGQVGTEEMTAVAIINQLFFVFSIAIFGANAGAGIFGAQFFGKGDHEGVRNTFRYKFYICFIITALFLTAFLLFGEELIGLYLHQSTDNVDLEKTLTLGKAYLLIILIKFIPFMFTQIYASTLRETGETVVPMFAGVIAILVNLVGNWLMIFGNLGVPELGVFGAAISTVIAAFIEVAIIVIYTHKHKLKFIFIQGAYKTMKIPSALVKKVFVKGSPLLVNEILWAIGTTALLQCYSVRGLNVVGGLNIAFTINGLFQIVFLALGGGAIPVIIGQFLGENKFEEAKLTASRMIVVAIITCVTVGLAMSFAAPFFPNAYNTSAEVKSLATQFILVAAIAMPIHGIAHSEYFILRSGGKTVITFVFDCLFLWVINIPVAFILSNYTGINIVLIYLLCQLLDIFKCVLGFILVKKGVWVQNIVN